MSNVIEKENLFISEIINQRKQSANFIKEKYKNHYESKMNLHKFFILKQIILKRESAIDKIKSILKGYILRKKTIDYIQKIKTSYIITTAIEHKAVLEPLSVLEAKGFEVTYIKPDISGRINPDEVLSNVRDDTLLVSVMHTNNETGVIQPIDIIGDALDKTDVFFHVDAAQSFGKLVDELKRVKYSFLSASAHKMYGPQGIGTLILRKKKFKSPPVKSIMFGGSQEHGIRPGTIPTALVAGFGKACEIALSEYQTNLSKYQQIKKQIIEMLDSSSIDYIINGDVEYSIPNTINISFNGVNSEALMLATKQYCSISNGSACNSHSYKPSHVLTAMGLDIERIESAIRISWGVDDSFIPDFRTLIQIAKSL